MFACLHSVEPDCSSKPLGEIVVLSVAQREPLDTASAVRMMADVKQNPEFMRDYLYLRPLTQPELFDFF